MGEPVEYRISGARWYVHGRQLGLNEPFPDPPDPAPQHADDVEPDPLDQASRIVSDAWEDGDGSEGTVS
jgi:hypothetical protein